MHMVYGSNLSIDTMDNQQVSSEQEKLQRLFRKEVGHKRLMPEVVRPQYMW